MMEQPVFSSSSIQLGIWTFGLVKDPKNLKTTKVHRSYEIFKQIPFAE